MKKENKTMLLLEDLEIEPLSDDVLTAVGGGSTGDSCCSTRMCSSGIEEEEECVWWTLSIVSE